MSFCTSESNIRMLTAGEILLVSGGKTSPAESAFVTAAGAAGAWAGSVVGTSSGADFGGVVGAIVCAPGGPEASAACGLAGAAVGAEYGSQIAGMSGAAAGAYIGQQIWNKLEDEGLTPSSFDQGNAPDSNQYTQIGDQAPSNVDNSVAASYSTYEGGDYGGGDYGGGDYGGGDYGGGDYGGGDYGGGGGGGGGFDDGGGHVEED